MSSTERAEKLLTKLRGFFDLVRDAGGQAGRARRASPFAPGGLARSANPPASLRVRGSASATLSNRRTFSIAIAAWSAKSRYQLDLLVGEGPHLVTRQRQNADRDALSQHRNAENGAEIAPA